MTNPTPLVEKLRAVAARELRLGNSAPGEPFAGEAADEIERLQALLGEVKEALRPFADECPVRAHLLPSERPAIQFEMGELRAAQSLLAKLEQDAK